MYRKILPLILLLMVSARPAKAQLTTQGGELPITYSGRGAIIATNTPAVNFSVTTGQNTFLLDAPSDSAARIYITNETANACNSAFQIQAATTGKPNQQSFNNNTLAWQTVPVISPSSGNYSANSGLVNVPASGTIVVTTTAISGLKLALFIINTTGGCASTNIDVVVIFHTVSISVPLIDVVAGNVISSPAVVCGGIDPSGVTQTCGIFSKSVAGGIGPANGMAIGAPGQSAVTGYLNVTTPNGNGGPLGVIPAAFVGVSNTTRYLTAMGTGIYTASKDCNTLDTLCSGMYISQAGIGDNENLVNGAVGTQITTFINYAASNGTVVAVHSCRFDLNVGSVATASGTGTLDFFIQDSGEITGTPIWTDRAHFPQIATSTTPTSVHQWVSFDSAQIPASCAAATCTTGAIVTQTDGTLAANTVITGAPGKFLRLKYVVAGNAVTFAGGAGSNTIGVYCQ